jgi:vancomycin aglycone glucosyltransferase
MSAPPFSPGLGTVTTASCALAFGERASRRLSQWRQRRENGGPRPNSSTGRWFGEPSSRAPPAVRPRQRAGRLARARPVEGAVDLGERLFRPLGVPERGGAAGVAVARVRSVARDGAPPASPPLRRTMKEAGRPPLVRIVLSADGTRGDLQPQIELGARLSAAGHDVVLCGPPDFAAQAASRGVRFVPCGASARGFLTENPAALDGHPARALREGMRYVRLHLETRIATLVELARGADLVVGAGAELAASTAAEASGVAYRYLVYCPAVLPSREHGPIFTPWQGLPESMNRLLWSLVLHPVDWSMRRVLAPARRRLGLDPAVSAFHLLVGARPLLAADPSLARAPADSPLAVDQVAALHPLDGEPLPAKLESFLEAGPPPVYLGFGSMPDADPAATTRTLVDAVTRLGCRAVIGSGWAELGAGPLPEGVLAIGAVSHPALFARCAAIVHHGGAGTTTSAARAGVPQVIVPHVADQFYWARRVAQLGLAGPAVPRRRLDAARLAAALESVLDNELVAERASELGARLRAEAAQSDPVRGLVG